MRILHLIDGQSPQASPTTLALLNESLGRLGHAQQRVLLLGGSALRAAAVAAGIRESGLASMPCGKVLLAWPAVRRQLQAWASPGSAPGSPPGPASETSTDFDLIHCWSVGACILASMAWRRVPRVLTLTTPPSASAKRWLGVLTREPASRCVLLPVSATLRREAIMSGVAPEAAHVLRPGLSLGLVDPAARTALRKRWGIRDERTKVVMLLSDPPHAADTMAAVMTLGLAEESLRDRADAPRLMLIVHPDQRHRRRGHTAQRNLGRAATIVQEPLAACPWAVLPGCDLALAIDHDWTGGEPAGREEDRAKRTVPPPVIPGGGAAGGLSLLWAMAANVPIVGEATYGISEIVEDRHSALLTRPGQAKSLAHRVVQLLDDSMLAYKLRDTARHEAYSFFSRQRYCESLTAVYQQVLESRPIEVPAMPVTGGLRFTGRA